MIGVELNLSFLYRLFLLVILLFPFRGNGQSVMDISVADAKADLEEMIQKIEEVHYNPYLHIKKEEFLRKKIELFNQWSEKDSISIPEFGMSCARVLTLFNDAHTGLDWFSDNLLPYLIPAKYFSLETQLIGGDLVLLKGDGKELNKGDKILSINQMSASELYCESMSRIAGESHFRNEMSGSIFFPLYLVMEGVQPPYELVLFDGRTISYDVSINIQDLIGRLSDEEASNYSFKILERNIAYINYEKCENYEAFRVFLKKTFREIQEKNIDKLIIDIRNNSGGNSSLNDLLLPYITKRKYRQMTGRYWKVSRDMKEEMNDSLYIQAFGSDFIKEYRSRPDGSILKKKSCKKTKPQKPEYFFEGKSCMLIGPKTFSSANMLADAVKEFKLTTLIGQPTGELTNDFGEQIERVAPRSGLRYKIAVAYDIGASGDADEVRTVMPDIRVEGDVLGSAKTFLLDD